MNYFSGRVHSVIFENAANAFYVLRLVLDSGSQTAESDLAENLGTVTIRGDIPGLKIEAGTWIGFEGVWDNHPDYGKQIRIVRAPVLKDVWDADMCEKILVSHKVGIAFAAKLRAQYGEGLAEALMDQEKILAVPGMTKFTAQFIHAQWTSARAFFLSLEFLNDLGLPQGRVRQIWEVFGEKAKEVLSENPWALVRIDGMNFADADTVASRLRLDVSAKNPARVEGAVLHACKSGRGMGHLYSSTGDMLSVVRAIDPDFSDADVAKAVKSLDDQDQLFLDRTKDGTIAIYDPWSYKIEQEAAELLIERKKNSRINAKLEAVYAKALAGELHKKDTTFREAVDLFLERYASVASIKLSPDQAEGVRNAACEPVSVITGLPGTGKTTSLRMVVTLLQEAGISFLIVAPTGIAAKRVTAVTGAPAFTIHRAFKSQGNSSSKRDATYVGVVGDSEGPSGSDGSSEEWGYSPDNPHPAEVIIVDESSMVDQHLLYRLVTCSRKDARLVFVGDAAQLPSVGPGNVLRDLIASKLFPTVSLTKIFRQENTSPIVHAAHAIFRGEVPEAPSNSDFALLETSDDERVTELIVRAAKKLYDKRAIFQVLSPRHNGVVGVTTLNAQLREIINPKQPQLSEMKIGAEVIREDDRIMVVKNDYELGIFNGDVGKVSRIDRKNKEVEIKIHGPPVLHVTIPFGKVSSILRLAYAVTVHKSQGQEYDVIVLPVCLSFSHQLQRNLLYTAVTRAKKKVILIGTRSALVRAVANERESARNTLLKERLIEISEA